MLTLVLLVSISSIQAKDSVLNAENLEALLGKNLSEPFFSGRVSGTVTEAGTDEPLIGASILVKGTLKGNATNSDGEFIINNVDAGEQILVVSYLGFQTKEIPVVIVDGETLEIEIELEWEGVQGEEVTITAQARGQVAAINQQLGSNTISNVVSKDRIQEVPDVNAAESIGRLPGIAIQRSGGEANKVLIRGLSPKFSTVTVNGVRLPNSGGDDRSVDLALVSSSILDGIEVKKAITADMDADAVAGSVDLKLREAPEGLLVDVTAQGGYTQLQKYYENYKISGTVSNRFLDNKLGVIATVNADQYDRSADQMNASYDRYLNSITDEYDAVFLESVNAQESKNIRNRIGWSLVSDYKLPKGKITANAFYNRLNDEGTVRTNSIFNIQTWGRAGNQITSNESTNSVFTSGISTEQNFGWVKMDAGVSYTRNISDTPRNFLASFRHESSADVLIKDSQGTPLWPSDTLGAQPLDVLPYVRPDSSTNILGTTNFNSTKKDESNYGVQLNLTFPFEVGSSVNGYVKVGGKMRWLDRTNDQQTYSRGSWAYLQPDINETTGVPNNAGQFLQCIYDQTGSLNGYNLYNELVVNSATTPDPYIPIYYFDTGYERDNFLTGEGGDGFPIGYTPSIEDMKKFINATENCTLDGRPGLLEDYNSSRGNDYEGEERYNAAYVMSEIKIGDKITFIPGLRWENDYSRFSTETFELIETGTGPSISFLDTLNVKRNYDFILPMVHLQIDPVDWLKVRLAYTETLSRPNFTQYIPRSSYNALSTTITANNSNLKPAESSNYDLSVSVFQNHVGLFTVSAFTKTIKDLPIWTERHIIRGVDTLTAAEVEAFNIPNTDTRTWLTGSPTLQTYINAPFDTKVRGIELDWQTNFWYLPSFLKGLVLSINYTRMFSETTYQQSIKTGDVVCISRCGTPFQETVEVYTDSTRSGRAYDQPANLMNVTLGYDFKGFSARISYLYQGDRFTGYRYVSTPVTDSYSAEYQRWDLTVKQRINNMIEVFGNFSNLTSRPDRNIIGESGGDRSKGFGSTTFVQYYGFTMDLGLRLRF